MTIFHISPLTGVGDMLTLRGGPDSDAETQTARLFRAPTLDGGAVMENFGLVSGDRTITISSNIDETQADTLKNIASADRVILSYSGGLFIGAIRSIGGTGPTNIEYWVEKEMGEAEPVPVAPVPLPPPVAPATITGFSGYWDEYTNDGLFIGQYVSGDGFYTRLGYEWEAVGFPPATVLNTNFTALYFDNVAIPQGGVLTSAIVTAQLRSDLAIGADPLDVDFLVAQASPASIPFDAGDARALYATATDIEATLSVETNTALIAANVASGINSLIASEGWTEGNILVVIVRPVVVPGLEATLLRRAAGSPTLEYS